MSQVTGSNPDFVEVSNLAVAVPQTGNTELLSIPVVGKDRIFVSFDVTGFALDAFVIQGKSHASAAAQTIYSLAAQYTSPTGLLVGASGDLTVQAAASTGWFVMDVKGFHTVKVLASSGNAAGSTVSAYGTGV